MSIFKSFIESTGVLWVKLYYKKPDGKCLLFIMGLIKFYEIEKKAIFIYEKPVTCQAKRPLEVSTHSSYFSASF